MEEKKDQEPVFEVSLAPETSKFDPEDDRWRRQVGELLVGLQQEVGGVRRETAPTAGAKGGAEQIIVALGSAGAFTAVLEFVKMWLARDRTRSLEISWAAGGVSQTVSVTSDSIDPMALQQLAQAVATRIGGTG